jgi:hypothetical protein
MSDSVGAWTAGNGSWAIVSNQAKNTTATEDSLYDSVMDSSTGDQRANLVVTSGSQDGGIACRLSGATHRTGYFVYSSNRSIYRWDNGVYTSIASGGGACSAGDVLSIDATGTSISCLRNGSTVTGPVTDSNHATGRGGLYGGGSGTYLFDDWYVEVAGATGSPWYYYAQQQAVTG